MLGNGSERWDGCLKIAQGWIERGDGMRGTADERRDGGRGIGMWVGCRIVDRLGLEL